MSELDQAQASEATQAQASESPAAEHDSMMSFAAKLDEAMTDDSAEPSQPVQPQPVQPQPVQPQSPQPAASAAPASPQSTTTTSAADRDAQWLESLPEAQRQHASALVQERAQLSQQVEAIRDVVADSGMDVQGIAELLEYGRLLTSGEPQNMRVALEMLDQQRAYICQQLGIEGAGFDPLAAHADLKKALEDFTISKDHALEIARARAARTAQERRAAEQHEQQAADEQRKRLIAQSSTSVDQYLARRAHQPGHAAKMAALGQFFQDPHNLQQFVKTYQPEQWAATVAMMYEQIAPMPSAPVARPLSRHAAGTGAGAGAGLNAGGWIAGTSAEDAKMHSMAARLSALGI